MSPRTFDPGLPSWMREDELAGLMTRRVHATRVVEEDVRIRYQTDYQTTIEQLIADGYLDEDNIGDADSVEEAMGEWMESQPMEYETFERQGDGEPYDHWSENFSMTPAREEEN